MIAPPYLSVILFLDIIYPALDAYSHHLFKRLGGSSDLIDECLHLLFDLSPALDGLDELGNSRSNDCLPNKSKLQIEPQTASEEGKRTL